MNKDIAAVSTKELEELIDELKYLEGRLIPLINGDSSLIKKLESLILQLDRVNNNLEAKLEQEFKDTPAGKDIILTNRFILYALVSDEEALRDSVEFAKKLDDTQLLNWLAKKQKDLKL
jgi:hypothetical protein